MLKEPNVRIYPNIADHFKHMKQIGLSDEFKKWIERIKETYSRRPRLMEELKKKGL